MGLKWYALIISVIIVWSLIYWAIIPAVNFLFLSTKDSSELEKFIITPDFIPSDLSIQDVVSDDLYLTAWDLNHRTPRFFSKWSQKNQVSDVANHNMPLGQMTLASAMTPYYFKPVDIEGSFYISGDNVAMSPAMFAYYYANEKKDKAASSIRVVSVGATNEIAEKIDVKASLLEWATRLTSLNAPVKKHTQDYMLSFLLDKDNHDFHKFELDTDRDFENDFYYTNERLPKLKELSQDMIYSNKQQVDDLIDTLVKERISNSC